MSLNAERKTSAQLVEIITGLNTISRENGSSLWRDVAERLASGRRRYSAVDLGKIERMCADGDHVVVAGSVLGGGKLEKKVTISALKFSKQAEGKISESGSKIMTLLECASENPKGTGIRVIR